MTRLLLRTFLITLAVWAVFSWPLPRQLTHVIPSGPAMGNDTPQYMEPGDHLQLMYHFRLFGNFVAGRTPWFHNLYEYNTGDDAARFEPGSYYLPFSLFHTVGEAIAGPAFGWNLAGFLSLWLTYIGSILLARRYTTDRLAAAACALLAITFPYRWFNLAGGSPTGFAMLWVPWLFLGLDIAVRESRVRGGVLAGFAMLMASWGDMHVFFFSALVIPCWCLVALVAREPWPGRDLRAWLGMALATVPAALGALAALWIGRLNTREISTTRSAEGRSWHEVALFSPRSEGFLGWHLEGPSDHIYLGWTFLALAAVLLVLAAAMRRQFRRRAVLLLLLAGMAGICALALGTFGPVEGRGLAAARKLIPQYVMIRQPAKIFCLLPSLLIVATAIGVSLLAGTRGRHLLLGLTFAAVMEYHARFTPRFCILGNSQGAYAAAARVHPERPATLVLPLWPGDSHFTSIYQHHAATHQLRMVNGYRPFVAASYIEDVFHPLESVNKGGLDDAQFDLLGRMGVQTVLLHEDLFPEKVSPFPAARTLHALLNHPRLSLLAQDGPVWAFRIEAQPVARDPIAPHWTTYFSARHYTGRQLRERRPGEFVTPPTTTIPQPDLRWWVRASGHGELELTAVTDEGRAAPSMHTLADPTPRWITTPIPPFTGLHSNHLAYATRGTVNVDHVLLAAGPWPQMAPGESLRLPAPCFFHAGYTDLKKDTVILRAGHDRSGLVFYGPKLPVGLGSFRAEFDVATSASDGKRLGTWIVTCPEGTELAQTPVVAGERTSAAFSITNDLPLLLIFQYHGTADVEIRSVTIARDT